MGWAGGAAWFVAPSCTLRTVPNSVTRDGTARGARLALRKCLLRNHFPPNGIVPVEG